MTTENNASFDIGSLLDSSLEDLPDLPSTEAWPAGAYKATLTLTQKAIANKPCVEAKLALLEVLEIPGDAVPPNPKDETSALFFLDNQWGLGAFKKLAASVAVGLGLQRASARDVIEACQGVEVGIIMEAKLDRKNNVLRNSIKDLTVE